MNTGYKSCGNLGKNVPGRENLKDKDSEAGTRLGFIEDQGARAAGAH